VSALISILVVLAFTDWGVLAYVLVIATESAANKAKRVWRIALSHPRPESVRIQVLPDLE
jgi:hypothetical protein